MAKTKLTLTFDELHTPQVDAKVQQQAALATAQINSQRMAALPSPLPVPGARSSLWYNTVFNMTVFGLLGGLLAWGCGELVHYLNPDLEQAAREQLHSWQEVFTQQQSGILDARVANNAMNEIDEENSANPYYVLYKNFKLTTNERNSQLEAIKTQEGYKKIFADICFYSACGMMIAVCLGMAESITTRNFQSAIIYGSVGAALGLFGGIAFSLFANRIYHMIGGGRPPDQMTLGRQILARSASWAVLGVFLSAAPGIVLRNWKKFLLGLVGGFVGGLIGGALFDPIAKLTADYSFSSTLSRLIAILAIGVVTGVGTGLIENATKMGWLKVTEGLIAGKQFILYRNPTFIGSAPQCEIYLFRDKRVGRRHAALHILQGGYEIEDLGSGGMTIVNGKAIARVRLHTGDDLQIGSTRFSFQERAKALDHG